MRFPLYRVLVASTLAVLVLLLSAPSLLAQEFALTPTDGSGTAYEARWLDCPGDPDGAACAYEVVAHDDADGDGRADWLLRPRVQAAAGALAGRTGLDAPSLVLYADRSGLRSRLDARALPTNVGRRLEAAADGAAADGAALAGPTPEELAALPPSVARALRNALAATGTDDAELAADINQTDRGLDPIDDPVVYNGALYFAADDGTTGEELWRFDGTTTALVADINPGRDDSDPRDLIVYDGALYFRADDGTTGEELWRYDGTAASLVADIVPGADGSRPGEFAVFDGVLYFGITFGVSNGGLWQYDGTTVSLAADIRPGSSGRRPSGLAVYDGVLYFAADDGAVGRELWQYDGTTASLAADINPGGVGSNSNPGDLTVFDGALYFRAATGTTSEDELWRYDGTTASRAADINPGVIGSDPVDLTVYDGALYFAADDGTTGEELWRFDGTSASLAADIDLGGGGSRPRDLTVYDGALYFAADDGTTGEELWRFDGTSASLAADIDLGGGGSRPRDLIVYDGTLYFEAEDGAYDGLWSFDGSTARRAPGGLSNNSTPREFAVYDDALYFSASDGTNGRELWRYTAAGGATLAAEIRSGTGSSEPQDLTVYDGALYFSAFDDASGRELWRYTAAGGATLAAEIRSGTGSSEPQDLTVYDGALYFSAFDDASGRELWRYTAAGGATLAAEIRSGTGSSEPQDLTVYDGALYFSADDDASGRELWRYTAAGGATLAAEIRSGTGSSEPQDLTAYDGALYFSAFDDASGRELWRYTAAGGATLAAEIRSGTGSSEPQDLTVYDGALYFSAFDDASGRELWRYTAAGGATLAAEIRSGTGSSEPQDLTVYDGALYFSADDGTSGIELWHYTLAEGASLASDLYPGGGSGNPSDLIVYQGALYFGATDLQAGYELFRVGTPVPPDNTPPTGYTAAFDQTAINAANETAASFTISSAEVGATYAYAITSDGGASEVTGTGTVTMMTEQVTGIDVSSLPDGTLSLSVTLTDAASNEGDPATDTAAKDTVAPTLAVSTTASNPTSTEPIPVTFTFNEAVVGFEASGVTVTGGTLGVLATSDNTTFTGDVVPSGTGEVTVAVASSVATDLAGNSNDASNTLSVTFDDEGPTGYTASFDQATVNAANETAVSFTIQDAEEGATYAYTITSDGGSGEVTGSGTIGGGTTRQPGGGAASARPRGNKGGSAPDLAALAATPATVTSEQVTGIDVSSLPDGTLTLSVTLTDPVGNAGDAANDTVDKDTAAPTVAISTTTPEPTVQSPFPVTFSFSEAVTGFEVSDVDVTNGTLSDFDDSAAPVYTANVTPTNFGEVTVSVDAGVATDAAGNPNTADSLTRTYEERFDLALTTDYVFTGPGTGTLTATVTNTGSVPATRVRVKITKTFDVATGPKQLVVGALAPGESGDAAFDFGSAGAGAEVRLKVEDLVVRNGEPDRSNNRAIVFLVPGDGGADTVAPEIAGALSGQVFGGTAEENRIDDTGVASVTLDGGATNLRLTVDPFTAGATVVSFTAEPIDPTQDASGTIRATDVAGNPATRFVSIPGEGDPPPEPPEETLVVRLTPDEAPIFIGVGGGSFTFTGEVTNPTGGRLTQQVWLVLISPSGFEEVQFGPFRVRLDAGGMTSERFTVTVDREAEAGVYTYEGRVGDFPNEVTDTDRFTFEKLGGTTREAGPLAAARSRGSDASAVADDSPTADTPSASLAGAALAGAATPSAVSPSAARAVLPVLSTTAGLLWGITDDAEWDALADAEREDAEPSAREAAEERAAANDDVAATDDLAAASDDAAEDTADNDAGDPSEHARGEAGTPDRAASDDVAASDDTSAADDTAAESDTLTRGKGDVTPVESDDAESDDAAADDTATATRGKADVTQAESDDMAEDTDATSEADATAMRGKADATRVASDDPADDPADSVADDAATAEATTGLMHSEALPEAYALVTPYPNPIRDRATVRFALPEASGIRVTVYDLRGRTVATLTADRYEAGRHDLSFDARALASGTYIVRLVTPNYTASQKVTVLR